jgi:hypothetical protein
MSDLYDAVQVQNINASPCSEGISLEEAAQSNQRKLHQKYQLGGTDAFSHNYHQIKLSGTIYSECRLYILHQYDDFIGFHLIVPDSEVRRHGYDFLKTIAKSVVMQLPIEVISTGDEIAFTTATVALSNGDELAIQYFGYTKDEAVLDSQYLKCTTLNNGYFIEHRVS